MENIEELSSPHSLALHLQTSVSVAETLNDSRNNWLDVDSVGKTVLHWALQLKMEHEVVNQLISAHPSNSTITDKDGCFPLRYALENCAHITTVQLLLDANQESCQMPFTVNVEKTIYKYGRPQVSTVKEQKFYVHVAVEAKCDFTVIESVLNKYPPAVLKAFNGKCAVQMTFEARDIYSQQNIQHLMHFYLDQLHVASFRDADVTQAVMVLCEGNASLAQFTAMMEKHTSIPMSVKNAQGQNTLHLAILHGVSVDVVNYLCGGFYWAMGKSDESGMWPLHTAVATHHSNYTDIEYLTLIRCLLKYGADTRTKPDKLKRLPLHIACKDSRITMDVLSELLPEDDVTSLAHKDEKSMLPLHYAVSHRCSVDVIRFLVERHGQALRETGGFTKWKPEDGIIGEYAHPFHFAVYNQASIDVIQYLLTVCPEIAAQRDMCGLMPLAYALWKQVPVSLEVVNLLLDHDTEAYRTHRDNRHQRYLLHYAAACLTITPEVVRTIATRFPEQSDKKDENMNDDTANCPLTCAILAMRTDAESYKALLDVRPTLSSKECHDFFSLCASKVDIPWACVEQFALRCDPCGYSAKTLEMIAKRSDAHIICCSIIRSRLALKLAYGEIWHDFIDCGEFPSVVMCEVVQTILSENRGIAKALCYSKDKDGRVAINIARDDVKSEMNKYLLFCGRFELSQGPVIHKSATSVVVQALDSNPVVDWKVEFTSALDDKERLTLSGFCKAGGTVGLYPYHNDFCLTRNAKVAWFDTQTSEWLRGVFKKEENKTNAIVIVKTANGVEERSIPLSALKFPEVIEAAALFDSVDVGKKGYLTETEFIDCCRSHLANTRRVVLKFMRHEDQYLRELEFRKERENDSQFSLSGHLLECYASPDPVLYAQAIDKLVISGTAMREYKYCLVMPEADRNLDSIRRFERPDTECIRLYFSHIAQALRALHSNGIMHGDVKLLNAVRLNNHVQLIDLDASSDIYEGYAGAKFSSGVLPPEMFAELNVTERDQYEAYWKPFTENDAELARKVRPIAVNKNNTKWIVVKTFRYDSDNMPILSPTLPYSLVPASTAIDAWSYGLMLFSMFARCPLLLVSDDDDLVPIIPLSTNTLRSEKQPIQIAKEWTKQALDNQLAVVDDVQARNLIAQLLDPCPETRLCDMSKVLAHPFFTRVTGEGEILQELLTLGQDIRTVSNKVDENTSIARENNDMLRNIQEGVLRLEDLSQTMLTRIDSTKSVLLKALIEANDVIVPSCFVIVNQRLIPASTVATGSNKVETTAERIEEKIKKAEKWMNKITGFFNVVSSPTSVMEYAKEQMADLFQGESLFLYLVDEVTMQPIIPEDKDNCYPIEITTQSDRAEQLVPLLKISLTAISVINSASGLARCLGYPTPCIPDTVLGSLRGSLKKLDQKSSIAEFDRLQDMALGSAGKSLTEAERTKVRGESLRQLQKLLADHDSDPPSFCGLQRVLPPSGDGRVIWTTVEGLKALESGEIKALTAEVEVQTEFVDNAITTIGMDEKTASLLLVNSNSADQQLSEALTKAAITAAKVNVSEPQNETQATQQHLDFTKDVKAVAAATPNTSTDVPISGDVEDDDEVHHHINAATLTRLSIFVKEQDALPQQRQQRQQSTGGDSATIVRHFEKSKFPVEVCVNVIFEAANAFFGIRQHNVARPRRVQLNFKNKVNLKRELKNAGGVVSGALVVQTLKKCQSITGQSLFYMLSLMDWDSLLRLETEVGTVVSGNTGNK